MVIFHSYVSLPEGNQKYLETAVFFSLWEFMGYWDFAIIQFGVLTIKTSHEMM